MKTVEAVAVPLELQQAVDLVYGKEPKTLSYHARVMRWDAQSAILDAARDADGQVLAVPRGKARLRWYDDFGKLWEQPVDVVEVMRPVPAIQVVYRGPATSRRGRKETRYAAHPAGRLIIGWPNHGVEAYDTMARDASFSMIRCFAPYVVKPPQAILSAMWTLSDTEVLDHSMRVVRVRDPQTTFRRQSGHDVIVTWEPPLPGVLASQWERYIKQFPRASTTSA